MWNIGPILSIFLWQKPEQFHSKKQYQMTHFNSNVYLRRKWMILCALKYSVTILSHETHFSATCTKCVIHISVENNFDQINITNSLSKQPSAIYHSILISCMCSCQCYRARVSTPFVDTQPVTLHTWFLYLEAIEYCFYWRWWLSVGDAG